MDRLGECGALSKISSVLGRSSSNLVVRTVGTFSISDGSGLDVLPSGKKERAILAVLSLSPGFSKSKAVLKSLFWPEADTSRASANLRQSLSRIRKAFLNACPLVSDASNVWLDTKMVSFAPMAFVEGEELLEGLDVNEEDFEDWLRICRQRWRNREFDELDLVSIRGELSSYSSESIICRPALIFVPPVCDYNLPGMISASEDLLSSLIDASLTYGASCVFSGNERGYSEEDIRVESSIFWSGGREQIVLRCRMPSEGRIFWTRRIRFDGNTPGGFKDGIQSALNAFADFLILFHSPSRGSSFLPSQSRTSVWTALDGLLRPGQISFDEMVQGANRAVELEPSAVNRGIRASMYLFRFGERMNSSASLEGDLKSDLDTAVGMDPTNGLVRALRGHADSYYFGNICVGLEQTKIAVDLSPWSSICNALHAQSLIYSGKFKEAEPFAKQAVNLSSNNLPAPFFKLIWATALALNGNATRALEISRYTVSELSNFRPALLLHAALNFIDGDQEVALSSLKTLRERDPSFTLEALKDPKYPIVGEKQRTFFLDAFKCLELR